MAAGATAEATRPGAAGGAGGGHGVLVRNAVGSNDASSGSASALAAVLAEEEASLPLQGRHLIDVHSRAQLLAWSDGASASVRSSDPVAPASASLSLPAPPAAPQPRAGARARDAAASAPVLSLAWWPLPRSSPLLALQRQKSVAIWEVQPGDAEGAGKSARLVVQLHCPDGANCLGMAWNPCCSTAVIAVHTGSHAHLFAPVGEAEVSKGGVVPFVSVAAPVMGQLRCIAWSDSGDTLALAGGGEVRTHSWRDSTLAALKGDATHRTCMLVDARRAATRDAPWRGRGRAMIGLPGGRFLVATDRPLDLRAEEGMAGLLGDRSGDLATGPGGSGDEPPRTLNMVIAASRAKQAAEASTSGAGHNGSVDGDADPMAGTHEQKSPEHVGAADATPGRGDGDHSSSAEIEDLRGRLVPRVGASTLSTLDHLRNIDGVPSSMLLSPDGVVTAETRRAVGVVGDDAVPTAAQSQGTVAAQLHVVDGATASAVASSRSRAGSSSLGVAATVDLASDLHLPHVLAAAGDTSLCLVGSHGSSRLSLWCLTGGAREGRGGAQLQLSLRSTFTLPEGATPRGAVFVRPHGGARGALHVVLLTAVRASRHAAVFSAIGVKHRLAICWYDVSSAAARSADGAAAAPASAPAGGASGGGSRQRSRLTDEQRARLLAARESLGIDDALESAEQGSWRHPPRAGMDVAAFAAQVGVTRGRAAGGVTGDGRTALHAGVRAAEADASGGDSASRRAAPSRSRAQPASASRDTDLVDRFFSDLLDDIHTNGSTAARRATSPSGAGVGAVDVGALTARLNACVQSQTAATNDLASAAAALEAQRTSCSFAAPSAELQQISMALSAASASLAAAAAQTAVATAALQRSNAARPPVDGMSSSEHGGGRAGGRGGARR